MAMYTVSCKANRFAADTTATERIYRNRKAALFAAGSWLFAEKSEGNDKASVMLWPMHWVADTLSMDITAKRGFEHYNVTHTRKLIGM